MLNLNMMMRMFTACDIAHLASQLRSEYVLRLLQHQLNGLHRNSLHIHICYCPEVHFVKEQNCDRPVLAQARVVLGFCSGKGSFQATYRRVHFCMCPQGASLDVHLSGIEDVLSLSLIHI